MPYPSSPKAIFLPSDTNNRSSYERQICIHLRGTIIHFINHRERIMLLHGAHCTAAKLSAIEKLRSALSFSTTAAPPVLARLILRHWELLESLMPGRKSKYYVGARKRLDELHLKLLSLTKYE